LNSQVGQYVFQKLYPADRRAGQSNHRERTNFHKPRDGGCAQGVGARTGAVLERARGEFPGGGKLIHAGGDVQHQLNERVELCN
jgi:hypothetical protein